MGFGWVVSLTRGASEKLRSVLANCTELCGPVVTTLSQISDNDP